MRARTMLSAKKKAPARAGAFWIKNYIWIEFAQGGANDLQEGAFLGRGGASR